MKFTSTLNNDEALNLLSYYHTTKDNVNTERLYFKIVSSSVFVKLIEEKVCISSSDKAKKGVKEILSLASGRKPSQIKNSDRLRIDLRISPNIHSRLFRPFNRLLKILGSRKIIRSKEVLACKKVEDCIKLIINNL